MSGNSKRLILMDLKYETLETVGKGAFATVVLVRDKDTKKEYIAKIVKQADLPEKQRQLVLNEAKLLAQLSHPHIIKYVDCYSDNAMFNIVMEYARHGDLWQIIQAHKAKEKRFQVPRILRWLVQMSSALFYLHSNDILHRDLKSKNILMADDDNLKIGDFGFSRILEHWEQTDTVCGTPHYMAPEMLANKSYNSKCDIWALGCILYECCMLQHAFVGQGRGGAAQMNSLMQKVSQAQYQPVTGYPEELSHLVTLILNPDPSKRPSCRQILLLPYVNTHLLQYVDSMESQQKRLYFQEMQLQLQEESDDEDEDEEEAEDWVR